MKQNLKTITLALIIGITLAGGITFAATIWNGTAWITDGSTISAASLKQNLDYLKEQILNGTAGLWSQNGTSAYYTDGNVGINTTAPSSKLEVAGKIEADYYCDRNGLNCKTAVQMGGDTGSVSVYFCPYYESGAYNSFCGGSCLGQLTTASTCTRGYEYGDGYCGLTTVSCVYKGKLVP